MRENTALKRMRAGLPALGASAYLGSPIAAEFLSLAGFDFVLVDNQHGLWDDTGILNAFHMICLGPATPMARAPWNDFAAIGRLLDRGALGIVVPMVNTVAEAEAAAYAARYQPRGGRSQGPQGARLHGADYMKRINDELFLAIQIETAEAAGRAEALLSVEGIDGVWIGPADLAATMGLDLSVPKDLAAHQKAILQVRDACRKVGKIPGIAAVGTGGPRLAEGFQFVTVAGDANYIHTGAAEMLKVLRAQVSGG